MIADAQSERNQPDPIQPHPILQAVLIERGRA
jgi:hypothetical protein